MNSSTKTSGRFLSTHLAAIEDSLEGFFERTRSPGKGFITWQDMVRLASAYGVTRVVKRPLSVDGLSMPTDSGKVILIKQAESPSRQRFTLAHEIAHLFLDEETTRQVWLRTPRGGNDQAHRELESFCDDLAARILMPRSWLLGDLKDKSPLPFTLLQLADDYGVSLQAMCIRAIKFLSGSYHIAEWYGGKGDRPISKRWQAAARGIARIMPETTTMQSPIGQMFQRCLIGQLASYSGEIVREDIREAVEIRGCLIRRGATPSMLTVTRRAKLEAGVSTKPRGTIRAGVPA